MRESVPWWSITTDGRNLLNSQNYLLAGHLELCQNPARRA